MEVGEIKRIMKKIFKNDFFFMIVLYVNKFKMRYVKLKFYFVMKYNIEVKF